MSILDRRLARDLWSFRGQALGLAVGGYRDIFPIAQKGIFYASVSLQKVDDRGWVPDAERSANPRTSKVEVDEHGPAVFSVAHGECQIEADRSLAATGGR